MAKKWECRICFHVHEGEQPPAKCPVCGGPSGEFHPVDKD